MNFIIDFLLLAASGAACFYCWVLSTRIKSITNTKDGIHTGIVALTQSAEEIQSAIASTKASAAENSANLEQLLAEADKKIPELRELMSQITEISQTAVQETETATTNLFEMLTPHIKEAQAASYQLLDALEAKYTSETVALAQADVKSNAVAEETQSDAHTGEIDLSAVVDEDMPVEGAAA